MFVALYWWRVKPGKEAQFREGWSRATKAIMQRYGALGSRLHREHDGRFVAYAQWPDELTWRRFFDDKTPADTEAFDMMHEAILESGGEPMLKLTVTDDHLQPMPRND